MGSFHLNDRALDIFRQVVEAYVNTGEAVGSRTLSKSFSMKWSPATIRNVLADLEEVGLLYAPHTSAGRLPTEAGLRYYITSLLEITDLTAAQKQELEAKCKEKGVSYDSLLNEASSMLSGLTHCASLVLVPQEEDTLRHIEFVPLSYDRALVVMVTENGMVQNRIIDLPDNLDTTLLTHAGNYLKSRVAGRTLDEAKLQIARDLSQNKAQLDELSTSLVQQGLAVWGGGSDRNLIVKGQSHLLSSIQAREDAEKLQQLFQSLETQEGLLDLLDASLNADGVQIFIGAEHPLFDQTECSMVISPYKNNQNKIIGAVGVLGPKRLNYGRVIPVVDYTARIIEKTLLNQKDED